MVFSCEFHRVRNRGDLLGQVSSSIWVGLKFVYVALNKYRIWQAYTSGWIYSDETQIFSTWLNCTLTENVTLSWSLKTAQNYDGNVEVNLSYYRVFEVMDLRYVSPKSRISVIIPVSMQQRWSWSAATVGPTTILTIVADEETVNSKSANLFMGPMIFFASPQQSFWS